MLEIYVAIILCFTMVYAKTYYSVTTVVGRGREEGENIAPTASYIDNPLGLWGDKYGRIYFTTAYRIRMISQTFSTVATIAGNSLSEDTGLGGLASKASLNSPLSLFVTTNGTVYLGDYIENNGSPIGSVKKIDNSGYLNLFSGYGNSYNDNISALSFSLTAPNGVWGDTAESIYIVDLSAVFKVKHGLINRVVGTINANGNIGDGGDAASAYLDSPNKCWVDTHNNMYITQGTGIRKVDGTSNIISTYGGLGSSYDDNIAATSALIQLPQCVVGYQNALYVCVGTSAKKIDFSTGIITTVAGGGLLTVGAATSVSIEPMSIWFDSTGTWYMTEITANSIRRVDSNFIVSLVAGGVNLQYSGDGGSATLASLKDPFNAWINTVSDIYISDTSNYAIRRSDHSTNIVSSFAGSGSFSVDAYGTAAATAISILPYSVWGDSLNSAIYIAENGNSVIVRVSIASSVADVFAGNFITDSTGDSGPASFASLYYPRSIVGDTMGNIYISQSDFIRKVNTANIITTTAGGGSYSLDGIPATSTKLIDNYNMWVNSVGDYFVWEVSGLKRISGSSGIISIYAGGGAQMIADGVSALDVYTDVAYWTNGVWGDTTGVLYLSDNYVAMVYVVSTSSTVDVLAGYGAPIYGLDSHDALSVNLEKPRGVMLDSVGSCYFADGSRIRKLTVNVPSYAPTSQPTNPTGQPSKQPSSHPSRQPSRQPTSRPTRQPSCQPTTQPTSQPSVRPSTHPSCQPSSQPSYQPLSRPTTQPSSQPSARPSRQPSATPSRQPSSRPTNQPSIQPSSQPSRQPTSQPSTQPSAQPIGDPSMQPSNQPSRQPTCRPSVQPSRQPSCQPVSRPSEQPTTQPSSKPSSHPLMHPTSQPSCQPVCAPSAVPTRQPSSQPTRQPSSQPSVQPSRQPSAQPTRQPTTQPSSEPSIHPIVHPTNQPSNQPSFQPTRQPSMQPSAQPTAQPTMQPSAQPSRRPSSFPSNQPSCQPSSHPSCHPSNKPSGQPSCQPSARPTNQPSEQPTAIPSAQPFCRPTRQPTNQPSKQPTRQPTRQPSSHPSIRPSASPSNDPSRQPTSIPTATPSEKPTSRPSEQPQASPTGQPSSHPTGYPSSQPIAFPTQDPSGQPSVSPSSKPNSCPSSVPSALPSVDPSQQPSSQPTVDPTSCPTRQPSGEPSMCPSSHPSCEPSQLPSAAPSKQPSTQPSCRPNSKPSCHPTSQPLSHPSGKPSHYPSSRPTSIPSYEPSSRPSTRPTVQPSRQPSRQPSYRPTGSPSRKPSSQPSSLPSRHPSALPSTQPVVNPSAMPSVHPTDVPTCNPSAVPSERPSDKPTQRPSSCPSSSPTSVPTWSMSLHYRVSQVSSTNATIALEVTSESIVSCAAYEAGSRMPISPSQIQIDGTAFVVKRFGTIALTGLIAVNEYTVLCLAQNDKVAMSTILEHGINISTICCRSIHATLSSSTLLAGINVVDFLRISFDSRPLMGLSIVTYITLNDIKIQTSMVPSVWNSTSTTWKSSLSSLDIGSYICHIILVGSDSNSYSFGLDSSHTSWTMPFTVVTGFTPNPPVLTRAIFNNDGTFIIASFDSFTDRGNLSAIFECSKLFNFSCVSIATCKWTDPATINVLLYGEDYCVSVGDSFRFLPTVPIRADCNVGCARQSTPALSTTLIVEAPTNPITPVVVISAPVVIGPCDSLTLDVTSSTGHGGRSWSIINITVHPAYTELQAFLSNQYMLSPPSPIPEYLLAKNSTLNFVVTLCNFLGRCNFASYDVTVLPAHVPVILLAGSVNRAVLRKNELSIGSRAAVSSCSGLNVSSGLTYDWRAYVNDVYQPQLVTTSLDKSKMRLPSYTLAVGVVYTFTLTVVFEETHRATSTSVAVLVQQGSIVAKLSCGSSLTVSPGIFTSIDASSSYDEDISGVTNGLVFAWSCMQTNPILLTNCRNVFNISSSLAKSEFKFTAKSDSVNGSAIVSVSVSDTSTSRVGTAQVLVRIALIGSPTVALASNVVNNVLNIRQSLTLTGSIQIPPYSACNASWSVNDSATVDLNKLAQTPVVVFAASGSAAATKVLYLGLPGNSLPIVGWSGLFTLSCRLLNGNTGSASIAVSVNAAPSPGYFVVTPANGTQGYWLFAASRWTDSDLPLQYQFGFVSLTGSNTVVLSKTEFTYGTALIPPGPPSSNYSVVCFVNVFDALQNNATRTKSIRSLPIAISAQSLLANSGSTLDQIKQTASYVVSLLNAANCSHAPNCTNLNRNPCATTPNTCGACVSGYLGDEGSANSACHKPGDASLITISASKMCPSNCSYHGVCQYVSVNSGAIVDSCRVGNSQCTAQCFCLKYHYGSDCSLSVSQMDLLLSARTQVINLIAGLLRQEDADEQSVEAWITSMSDATIAQSELSSTAIQSIFNASTSYLSLGYAVGVSTVSTLGVLSSVDNAAAAAKLNGITGTSVGNAVGNLLLQFQAYASAMMVPSQVALQLIYSQFRTVIDVPAISTFPNTLSSESSTDSVSLTESIPLTTLETSQNQPSTVVVSSLNANSVSGTVNPTNSSVIAVSISAISAAIVVPQVNSSVLSPVITTTYSLPPVQSNHVNLTIPFSPSLVNFANSAVVYHESTNVTCLSGHSHSSNFSCSDGSVVTIHCNGTEAGLKSQLCPVTYLQPVINTVSHGVIGAESCSVIEYSNTSISGSCPLVSNETVAHDDGYSVSYIVMLKSVEKSFVSTIRSAQGLNESTLNKSWKCLTTMGLFIGFVLISLFWSNFMDGYESEFNSKMSSKVSPKAVAAKNSWIHMQKRLTNNKLMQIRGSNKGFQRNRDLVLIEGALPQIFRSQGMSHKVIKELKQHHRWFAIVFFYCKYFPRVLRVVVLFTNIVIMLFIQSLTYTLTNADNGVCETYSTEASCLALRSPYATSESRCKWTMEGTCKYYHPGGSVKIIVFVAVFSALISTPLALLVDWLVNHILAAPTVVRIDTRKSAVVAPLEGFARMADLENAMFHTRNRTRTRTSSGDDIPAAVAQASKMEILAQAQKTLRILTNELQAYREKLSEEQRKEFDCLWGLDETGNFYSSGSLQRSWFKKTIDVKKMILEDLCSVISSTNTEKQLFLRDETGNARGKRMLYLFQKDLLPGVQGQMLDAKSKRDNVQPKATKKEYKFLTWLFVALLNLGMLFYILLFALSQNEEQQDAWFKSFLLWLCLEIFFVSTAIVLLTHVLIPLLTMKDVNRIKQILLNSLSDFRENIVYKNGLSPRSKRFNAAQYLFVSSQMAKEFPKLKESKLIARFSTPWPKRSYQHVSDVSKQYSKKFSAIVRSLGLVLIYFMTTSLSLPPHLQDLLIHSVTTVFFGYLVLVHVELFNIFPLLAFVPVVVCGLAMHFWISSGRASALKDLHILQRRRQSTVIHTESKDDEVEKVTPVRASEFLTAGQVERQHVTRRQSIQEAFVTIDQLKAFQDTDDEVDDISDDSGGSLPSVGGILDWSVNSGDDSLDGADNHYPENDVLNEADVTQQRGTGESVDTDGFDQWLDEIDEEKVTEDEQ